MEATKNLCAQIPVSLHSKVCEEKDLAGVTMSQYITDLITDYYQKKERLTMDINTRTIAFQMPEELFQRLKKYLKAHDLKQKEFIFSLIQQALDIEEAAEEKES